MNAFDNGNDTRATVLIAASFKPGASADARSIGYEEQMAPTLEGGGGGNNKPAVLIFTAQRVGEPPRIYQDITPSLLSRMGTGGNNTPMIVDPEPLKPLAFDGYNQSADDSGIYRTLRIGIDSGDCLAIPIQDGREMNKHQNGLGISEPGAPAYTIDTTGAQAVCTEAIVAPTLTAANNPSRSPQSTEVTKQVEAVYNATTIIRRLTPTECERLMGWPDNHTLHRADGKTSSDSTRYKMCGNGVASPVARWIGEQLLPLLSNE